MYHFCEATGMVKAFESKNLNAIEFIGKKGKFRLKQKEGSSYMRVFLYVPLAKVEEEK